MGQNNQKDQKGPKMTAAVMLVQNNQNNQKIWSSHISHTILKVRFFWDTLYRRMIYIWTMISHSVDIWYPGGWYEPQQLAVAVSSLVRNSCFANKYKKNTNIANKYKTNTNTTCLKWKCYSFKKMEKWWNLRILCFLCLWQDLKILTLY